MKTTCEWCLAEIPDSFVHWCVEGKAVMGAQRMQVETYDGTIESAKRVLEKLNVKDYHFDVHDGSLMLHTIRIKLNPGDHYQYRLPTKPFKVMGG